MPKDDNIYVGHMLDMSTLAGNMIKGKSRKEYDEDVTLRLALAHLIQTIGEAARKVSVDFQKTHPEIPWSKIIGMRHKVVHDYLHVDYDILWDVVTENLPDVIRDLQKIISSD